MKAILAILLTGALYYIYQQQQTISSLREELQSSQSKVAALEKQIAETPAPAATNQTASSVPGSTPAARKPPSGQWMWQDHDNPLVAPPPSKQRK